MGDHTSDTLSSKDRPSGTSVTTSSSRPNPNADFDLSTPIPPSAPGLRSSLTSYGDTHFSLFLRRAFISALGYSPESLALPIVGIINTYSALNPCHANVPQLIDAIKRGVQLEGGLAVEFPTISIHESFASPTSMFLRNLMSMDTEEMIRAQPLDAVVAIGGCDKTVPAQLMGGISADTPFVPLVAGPMMPGSHRGVRVGACTDCRGYWAKYRAGEIDMEEIGDVNIELAPTGGTCGVMGTASTMACILAGLGLIDLRAGATASAVSAARLRVAEESGRRAVQMIARGQRGQKVRPQEVLDVKSFLNAITVLQAIGGSTNAVVHLLAIIGRHPIAAKEITLNTIDEIGRKTPLLVDLKPSGEGYMTDFHNAGGMLALMHVLRPVLHLDAMTYTGQTLGELLDSNPFRSFPYSQQIIRPLSNPMYSSSSLVVLRGNLCPDGAVMKASASKDKRLLHHRGPACVFENTEDLAERVDSADLDVDQDSVLVLKSIGPVGNPGMPEAGMVPIPRKLAQKGTVDMLRISDGRMSGTAGGSVILHVSPESADLDSVFGIIQTGDRIVCDVEQRLLKVELSDEEIKTRIKAREEKASSALAATKDKEQSSPAPPEAWLERRGRRGYRGLYERHVNQAHLGCDFDFLTAVGPGSN